ncbi:MAG: alcohol dehydrogenase catalytic domain-containing protein, partial [Deltaproteobacteria bacterium]|nr:alcohol dehydrogenase catalytic domain-containing protein [Deltaproteobacteria bacterium]
MQALTFQAIEQLAIETIDDPIIEAPGDLILEVEVAGVCGSDLHVYHGRETGLDVGTVMGHEYLGRVAEVGSGVAKFNVGDRVVGPFTTNCGNCFYCRRGLTCRCSQGQLFGWREQGEGLHGSQAQWMR